ncbi:MAG: N-acetylmuramoyl-L-alanine amidase [Syntrophales bacterium]
MRLFSTVMVTLISVSLGFPANGSWAKDAQGNFTVIVDAGHGGNDRGVRLSGEIYEKDVTLAIARLLKKDLDQSKNIRTRLVRTSDRALSAEERIGSAGKEADLFISIHVNAGFGKNSSGFEIYFPGFKMPVEKKNDSGEIVKDMVRTQYLNESVRYSQIMMKHLEKLFPRKGRGLREAPIRIGSLTIPAVVLEVGFATNSKERKILTDPATQSGIAAAIGQVTREYFSPGERS